MDIEQLNKSQIVLLTLLVSFVTSIATGIVTVALMQQAPPAIVQSVSRVIKETVAQVAPSTQTQSAAVAAPTETKTVIVSDANMISQAVVHANKSVVQLYSNDVATPKFLGLGVIIDPSGTVVIDSTAVGDAADASVKRANGSYVRVFVTKRDGVNGLAYLTLTSTSTDPTSIGTPITFPTGALSLGDRAVALENGAITRIQEGFVTGLLTVKDTGTVAIIETDIAKSGILSGTPLIDTNGAIIGISTEASRVFSGNDFIPVTAFTPTSSYGTMKETITPTQ